MGHRTAFADPPRRGSTLIPLVMAHYGRFVCREVWHDWKCVAVPSV